MGRRKIEIKAIKDDRNRSVTFLKRKGGLFKKAHELSVLCSVDVAVFVFGNNKKLYEYSSIDMRDLIAKYQYHGGPSEHKGPSDYNGGSNDDDDDDDVDITPPPGHDGIEAQMMPRHFQGQQQHLPPPPPPFPIVRHHAASVSPPMGNGVPYPGHQAHLQRNGTPQPPITSRPGSRNDMRHMGRGIVGQPVGPHGPHPGMAYGPPAPIYNHNPPATQPGLMPPGASYAYQSHQPQQPYAEEHRPSAPPSFSIQPPPPQGVPGGPRATPSPPQPHHQTPPSNAIQHHMSPQPERRHLDPQPPPPPLEPKADPLELSKQQLLNTSDMAIKKMPQRKSHSIFTPIEENRSVLSQHLASFAAEPQIKVESRPPITLGPSARSHSLDAGPVTRNDKITSPPLQQRASNRTPSVSSLPSLPESLNSPQTSSSSLKIGGPGGGRARGPRLTVQIPDGASEADSATGESTSPRNSDEPSSQTRQRHNSTTVVLPPPSPSAQTLLSAGATGPPNPFARPPPQQNINGETPASALPSRFLNSELLPSPSSFYPEWNLRGPDSTTMLSPMNFATPVVSSGPSFLRDDAHPTSNSTTGVTVPTITTTAASDSITAQPSGSTKRKSSDAGTDGHDPIPEIASEAKRLKV